MAAWVDVFKQCHKISSEGIERLEWPDGGAYYDQDNITVSMFSMLEDVVWGIIQDANKPSK